MFARGDEMKKVALLIAAVAAVSFAAQPALAQKKKKGQGQEQGEGGEKKEQNRD